MEHEDPKLMHAARFSFFALGFLLFWWASYFLAIAGFFSPHFLAIFGIIMGMGAFMAARKWLSKETLSARILFAAAILFSASLMYFAEPTVFSGRDQGSISEAAFELVRTKSLSFSFPASETLFGIYGEGKALNFPGFFYQEDGSLTTQFPLGYTVWTALWTAFFELDGFRIGNGILLTLSILSLFLLVRTLSDERYAIGATMLFAASFLPTWFAKFTLTENAALFLFLFLALNLILFLRENRPVFFLGAYFSGLLLAVTRIEGIWMLGITLIVLFLSKQGRAFVAPQKTYFRTAPLCFAFLVLVVNFLVSLPFYTVMAKALHGNVSSLFVVDPTAVGDSAGISLALWKLFAVYGLLPIFLVGFAGILFLIRKKRFVFLIPALLALPTFLYFVDPNITHDHPWMLRRFLPFAFPALLLSGAFALSMLVTKRERLGNMTAALIFILVIISGFPAFARTSHFADNRGFLETTAEIAPLVGAHDLLLIDRGVSGDHFSIPAGPLRFLHGKNAAYFFNPEDYERMAKDGYERIYLLTPLDRFEEWEKMSVSFDFISAFTFSTKQMETLPLRETRFPKPRLLEQDAVLFELKNL
jgi:hypothetical protein